MSEGLSGRTVALAEGRQLEELASLLEKEGAKTIRCPMVSILDTPHEEPVLRWIRDVIADRFPLLVFFTGEGVGRLLSFAKRGELRDDFIAGLKRARIIVRGPKPVKALKEIDLKPQVIATPPTTEGVIQALKNEALRGTTVGVQLYAPVNAPLEEFLNEERATMVGVLPYVYAPDSDATRVDELIRSLHRGEIDVLILTSSPQVDRLIKVAKDYNRETELAEAWGKVRVAAVGPVVADRLQEIGAPVHICPQQGFVMKNLVKHIKDDFQS